MFENLKKKDNEIVKEYYSKMKEVVNQMKSYDDPIIDQKVVEKILLTLSTKFDSKLDTINESHDLSKLLVNELTLMKKG